MAKFEVHGGSFTGSETEADVNPYVYCDARTLVFFDSIEEAELMISNHTPDSIFWSHEGKLTQVGKNVLAATRNGLGYDLAAECYVCGECRSSSKQILYFKMYHSKACAGYVEAGEALLAHKIQCPTIPAWPVLPRYATIAEENKITFWMEATEKRVPQIAVEILKSVDYTNSKTGGTEKKITRQDVAVHVHPIYESSQESVWCTAKPTPLQRHKERKLRMRACEIEELVKDVISICEDQQIPFEVVDGKGQKMFPKIPLKHTMGYKHSECDPKQEIPELCRDFLTSYARIAEPTRKVLDEEIQPGWSGVVLHQDDVPDTLKPYCHADMFVVLGRCSHGVVQNALNPHCVEGLRFYGKKPWQKHEQCDTDRKPEAKAFIRTLACAYTGMTNLECVQCERELLSRTFEEQKYVYMEGLRELSKIVTVSKMQAVHKLVLQRMQGADPLLEETDLQEKQLVTPQLVDIWRTLQHTVHIPNRKLYMVPFSDRYGSFLFFPQGTIDDVFPQFMKPVTFSLMENGAIETNHRYIDLKHEVETCIEGLFVEFDGAYWNNKARQITKMQTLDECSLTICGVKTRICHWEGDVAVYAGIIRPTPSHLAFGATSRLLKIQDRTSRNEFVPRNGYCYMYIMACAMQFCDSSNRTSVDIFIRQACEELGAWPKFSDLLRKLNVMTAYYGCYDAPVPVILVDHINKTMHVPDPFGVQQVGMHTLRVNTLKELSDLDNLSEGPMRSYTIGGFKEAFKTISECVKSRKAFVQKLNTDAEWLVDMMLEPSLLFVLADLVDAHQVLLNDVGNSFDLMMALMNLKAFGLTMGPHLQTKQRVHQYMTFMIERRHTVESLVHSEGMKKELMIHIDLMQRDLLENSLYLEIDQVMTRKKILEEHDSMRAICVFNEYINSWGWLNWHGIELRFTYTGVGQRVGRLCADLSDNSLTRWFRTPRLTVLHTANISTLSSKVWTSLGSMYNSIFKRVAENIFQYFLVAICTMFGSYLLKRLLKLLKYEKEQEQEMNLVEYQSKREEAWISKFMACLYLVATFFSFDMSQAIYSNLVKFRTIFDILHVNAAYQSGSGIFNELTRGLGAIPHFHEIKLYNHQESTTRVEATMTTFERWFEARVATGQQGYEPLDGIHEKYKLSKNTIESVALQVLSSKAREILVEGSVGCGKSTRFTSELSKNGKVLICEPTRVLVHNLRDSLGVVTGINPSVMMRNYNAMTPSGITVTTYGYALHWLYHQPYQLAQFDYIAFDEVHHNCAEKIVLYNWLVSAKWKGKIIKLTATANNNKCDLDTQYPVDVKTFQQRMDVQTFMREQGTQTQHDVTKYGRVILVFLTSINEIDQSYETLKRTGRDFGIIKADSRTLRNKTSLMEDIEALTNEHIFILATNILQNGINVHAHVVFDFSQKIVPCYDEENRMLTTRRQAINRSDRIQRLGRVGRMGKGTAIKVGSDVDPVADIDEVTATEAALLSFAYGVAPVAKNVNVNLFRNVTSEQVKLASRFESQLSYMVWMANKDGSMSTHLYKLFSPLLLSAGTVSLSPYYVTLDDHEHFRRFDDYVSLGYIKEDVLGGSYRLPFHSHDISGSFAVKVAEAFKQSKMPTYITMKVPAVNHRDTAMRLSTNDKDFSVVMCLIDEALIHEKQLLSDLQNSLQQYVSTTMVLCPNLNARGKLLKAIERVERNVNVLMEHKTRVERASVMTDYEEIVKFLDDNPSVATHVMYQSGPGKFIDEVLLMKRNYSWAPYVAIGTTCVLVGVVWFMLYNRRRQLKFEGKKNRIKTDKLRAARADKEERMYNNQYTYYDQGDVLYHGAQEYEQGTSDWIDRVRKKKDAHAMQFGTEPVNRPDRRRAFNHFYGFDPAVYDKVRFIDLAADFSVEQTASHYNLDDAFRQMVANRLDNDDRFYGQKIPTGVIAEFYNDGEESVRRVEMTPHDPHRAGSRGLPVGFLGRRGEWRQTGPSQITTPVSFESKSMYSEAKPVDHLIQNQVILMNEKQSLNGLVVGRKLLAPFHFAKDECDGDTKMYTRFGCFNLGRAHDRKITKFTMLDLIGHEFPETFQPRKKLRCLREPVEGEKATLMVSRIGQDAQWHLCTSEDTDVVSCGSKHDGIWKHFASTQEGDCGGVLVAVKDKKVIGFHNLGGLGVNYFVPVTQEVLKYINDESELPLVPWKFNSAQVDAHNLIIHNSLSTFPITKKIAEIVNWQSLTMPKYCGENFKAIAQAPAFISKKHVITGVRPEFQQFLNQNPEWRGRIEHEMGHLAPSALNTTAYYKDLLKYNKPIQVGTVDSECFGIAVVSVVDLLKASGFKKNETKAIFDCGTIFNDLNLDAAMGALYSGKKKDYFADLEPDEITEIFENSVAKLGMNGHGVWSGLLKAELRPVEKVMQNKTRTFTSAPIDVLMGAKVVVDDFNKKFYERHLKGPWTVGINKFNGGWDLLARSLSKYTHYIDADGSQFDSSITPLLMNAVLNIREFFLEDDADAREILRNLYTQIVNTCILAGDGTIFQKFRGNNSGQPSTVVDNTLCLMIAMEYARARSVKDGRKEVNMLYVCNGDDLLINADENSSLIIHSTFAQYIKELELNYTFDEVYESIEQVEFMSHKFVKYKDMYIPKLKRERVVAILEWQRSKEPRAIQSAITAAYVEAFGYPDLMKLIEEFAQHTQRIWDYKLPTQDEVEQLYLHGLKMELDESEVCIEHAMFESGETSAAQQDAAAELARQQAAQEAERLEREQQQKARQEGINQARNDQGSQGGRGRGRGRGSLLDNPIVPRTPGAGDINDRVSGMVFPEPKVMPAMIYLPKRIRGLATEEQMAKVKTYLPRMEQIDSRFASDAQLDAWIKGAASGYGITEDEFINTMLPAWIIHCIVNTTSPETQTMNKWRAVNNAGSDNEQQVEYEIAPMIEHAKPTLRAIMRHFGDTARLIMHESLMQSRPIYPKAFVKAGVLSLTNMVAACDFIERKAGDTATFVQVQNQVLVNRVNGVTSRLFAQARPGPGINEDLGRHDAQDVTEGVHGYRGARLFDE